MADRTFTSLAAFQSALTADVQAREKRLGTAVHKAARVGEKVVCTLVPQAFRELLDSIHVEDFGPSTSHIVADAPHAAAVEVGSRPHTPPLAPLIAWVKLRGLQGLSASGGVKGNPRGEPHKESARVVATALHRELKGNAGARAWRANASGPSTDPATLAVARAIQMKIKKYGTKPTYYMRQTVEPTLVALDAWVAWAMPDR